MTMTTKASYNRIPLACIIMASGEGTRFGENKLLVDFQGKPLLQHILETIGKIPFAERIVVTRHQEVVQLCSQLNIPVHFHQEPLQSDTVRLGLSNLTGKDFLGYIFFAGDQPFLNGESINNLCAAFLNAPDYIHRTCYEDTPGNPIIFPRKFKEQLMALPKDRGGSYLAKKYPEQVRYIPVQDSYELYDIDTKEDLEKLLLR